MSSSGSDSGGRGGRDWVEKLDTSGHQSPTENPVGEGGTRRRHPQRRSALSLDVGHQRDAAHPAHSSGAFASSSAGSSSASRVQKSRRGNPVKFRTADEVCTMRNGPLVQTFYRCLRCFSARSQVVGGRERIWVICEPCMRHCHREGNHQCVYYGENDADCSAVCDCPNSTCKIYHDVKPM